MIRTALLSLALVALTGTAFAQASSTSMASDAGMSASSSATKAPVKHHHKKHVKKAASSSMASDAGMAAPASDAASK